MPPLIRKITFDAPLVNVRLVANGSGQAVSPEEHYHRGRRDGESAARQELARERAELERLQAGIVTSMQSALPKALRATESGLVKLAMEVAERLVGGIPISAEMVEGSIRETLAHVEEGTEFQVLLHPADLELLRQSGRPLLPDAEAERKLVFQSSAEVTRGGCLVRTRFGVLDGRRESKLEVMKQALGAG